MFKDDLPWTLETKTWQLLTALKLYIYKFIALRCKLSKDTSWTGYPISPTSLLSQFCLLNYFSHIFSFFSLWSVSLHKENIIIWYTLFSSWIPLFRGICTQYLMDSKWKCLSFLYHGPWCMQIMQQLTFLLKWS